MSKEIAEKIAITVYGTDTRGEMFVEDTSTAVLAHEWIKLVLRKRMTPGSEIIVFNKTNGNQAEFLLEGADATGLFRARLKDLTVDIWEMDFGLAPEPVVDTRTRVHLICKCCGSQESVPLDSEEQAKAASGEVLWRHCSQCVEETDWQAESWLAEQRRLDENKRAAQRAAAPPPALVADPPAPPAREPATVADPEPAPVPEVVFAPPPALVADAPAPPPINWAEKRTSRRIQMKTRARVRRPDGRVEIVSPLNVSRGGIAFESAVEYTLDERIKVAMHYREGEEPLETAGVIVRVIPGANAKDYGVKFG
jgi:hypothetical protein